MVKVPKKSKTLTAKLRADNPWAIGDALADIVEREWERVQQLDDKGYGEFCHGFCHLPGMQLFCSESGVSAFLVADMVYKKYLR